ncbi:pole-localized protein SpbR [Caulobacter sp.]|uniref:pole-localized protein SpbR n=1 Tax=Caulobacter sp. TaxID=78 RepID=UPI003BA8AB12
MATTRAALTDNDIRMLVKGATADERALAAHKLCRNIDRAELADDERQIAHDILRVMATDAAELVRRAMAVTLKNSPNLPPDVANRLARDVDSISLPIITFSPVFSDNDLAEIVRMGGAARQMAVAKRPKLSTRVTTALVEEGSEEVVAVICANDNARFSEVALQKALDRFSKSEQVLQAVAYRSTLPLAVTERLIDMVGDQLRDHILSHHALSAERVLELVVGAKERATIDLVDQAGRAADPKAFVAHLNRVERLTPSLLLRALAHGHMTFFEWGVAELAGVPHHRTWLMIHDAGQLGLKAICERAGLPARLYAAFRAGVDAFHAMEFDGRDHDRERFQEHMIQRFLTSPQSISREDSDYLLERMDRLARQSHAATG